MIDCSINDRASGQDWLTNEHSGVGGEDAVAAATEAMARYFGPSETAPRSCSSRPRAQSRARAARTGVSRSATACLSSRTKRCSRPRPAAARPRGAASRPPSTTRPRARTPTSRSRSRWWCALARALDARRAGRAAADGAARARAPRDLALRAPPHASPELARRLRVCARQRSVFDPARCGGEQPRVVRGNWSREEPRLGAWGWGTERAARLGDRVSAALRPRAARDHRVHALVRVVRRRRRLDARRRAGRRRRRSREQRELRRQRSGFEKQRATQTRCSCSTSRRRATRATSGGVLGFGVAPYSNASLVFRFVSDPPLKVMIRLVSSC